MGNSFSRRPRPPPSTVFTNIAAPTTANATAAVGVPVAEGRATPPSANASAAESVTLEVSGEKVALAFDQGETILAMLSLKAPAEVATVQRPPMDVVCCIDRSGSMGTAGKMTLMKQTLHLLVTRAGLNAGDRIALVSFDAGVRLELGLTAMDDAGRQSAEAIVRSLQPGSTTNLSGGALKAVDVLDASASPGDTEDGKKAEAQQRTRAVMLFTDGLANEGIRDTTRLVAAVNGALSAASAKLGGPISLFTFGFGADHNEDCLRSLAVGSGASGLYYYVAKAEDIPNAFADCLGGLTSVVCQNATLTLSVSGTSATMGRLLNSTAYPRDASGALLLGDLFAEDEKSILVEVALPALPRPVDSAPCLTATLRAFNVGRAAPDVVEATLSIARPTTVTSDQAAIVNTALDEQRNRIRAAEAMEAASRMADGGEVASGRALLQETLEQISKSDSKATPLSLNLASQCRELEQQYRDERQYRAVGSKMSKMHAVSHMRQRANHMQSDEMYTSGAKRKMAMKSSWMTSLSGSHNDSDSD